VGHVRDRLGVLTVHVKHRDLEHPGDIARVARRARLVRIGGEPDLVVDDDVHRAAGLVALERREVQRLGDHALAHERRVAVDEQRHHPRRP
jgi:hypothetical protein